MTTKNTAVRTIAFRRMVHCAKMIAVSLIAVGLSGSPLLSQKQTSGQFRIEPTRTNLVHNRPDLILSELWMKLKCLTTTSQPANGHDQVEFRACRDYRVNGEKVDGYSHSLTLYSTDGRNVDVPQIEVAFESDDRSVFCIATKILFSGFSNQNDYIVYADPRDRYSILSYCSGTQPETAPDRFPYEHKQAKTLEEFMEKLSGPIHIDLTDIRP